VDPAESRKYFAACLPICAEVQCQFRLQEKVMHEALVEWFFDMKKLD